MTKFRKSGDQLTVTLADYEAALLDSLTEQLIDLLDFDQPDAATDDPFAAWEAELKTESLDRSDPVLARLFPAAYPDDEVADADFRRYTEATARRAKVAQARLVLAAVRASDGGTRKVSIPLRDLDAWLKTITALRLSLATRLGIETIADAEAAEELADDDPQSFIHHVYDWLGFFLEGLLERA